jgi:hypothetical protein
MIGRNDADVIRKNFGFFEILTEALGENRSSGEIDVSLQGIEPKV